MSDADRSYSYRASCGQITGRSHLKSDMPCQDYAAARTERDIACIALADGAGSRAYSADGARVVVRAVSRALVDGFEEIWALSEVKPSQASERLLAHCKVALESQAIKMQCEVPDLASTLLFVVHSKGRYLAGHVGDGCIVQQRSNGEIVVLSHPDNGEYANTTFFMTDSTAHSRFRLYRGESGADSGFVIMSDGTAESLYRRIDKSPATSAVRKIIGWCSTAAPKAMREVLAGNLEKSFAVKSADDCSIGVLALTPDGTK